MRAQDMRARIAAPTVVELPWRDPADAFAAISAAPGACFLDSAAEASGRGRYAYLAADPFATLIADGTGVRRDGMAETGDPFTALARALGAFEHAASPDLPPFQGGAIGFLGYELGRHLERLPAPAADDLGVPDMAVGLYDTVAAFDTKMRRACVIAHDVVPGRFPAARRAQLLADKLSRPVALPTDSGVRAKVRPEIASATFEAMVARTVEYIRAGDIFQANLTQRFLADWPEGLDPYALYLRLRRLSPAPFAAFLSLGGAHVISASPERFLALSADGLVETRPIKGTRPRGTTPADDARLAAELRDSAKDRAENLMIVDLLRNDLSRVCAVGSVRVPELFGLETFASVHHLVSAITGRLAPGRDAVDLLRAAFPGGSITGAPKIRAMEIIRELEVARRGPYCGTVLWIGFDGAMDSSIVIRTLVAANGKIAAQAGGGIVADSDPAAEYEEMLTKVRPLLAALDPDGGVP